MLSMNMLDNTIWKYTTSIGTGRSAIAGIKFDNSEIGFAANNDSK